MSSSNSNRQRDRLHMRIHRCGQCSLSFNTYRQLQNHKRLHQRYPAMNENVQPVTEDVEMEYADTIDDIVYMSDSCNKARCNNYILLTNNTYFKTLLAYTASAAEINNEINYKCGCRFEDGERAHVYDSSRIGPNTFTKAELMSFHLSDLMLQHKISRAAYRDIVRFVNTVIQEHDEIMMGNIAYNIP